MKDGSGVRLWFLGLPRVELANTPVEFGTRKAVALLAYLAATAQLHARETITSLLWPGYDNERASAALRTTLWTLRKNLGDQCLVVTRPHVGLAQTGAVWVDVGEFLSLIERASSNERPLPERISLLEQAVALYQDDFLTGFTLKDSLEFDDWQLLQTEKLRRTAHDALMTLVVLLNESGDYQKAIQYARRLLALDPLDEAIHEQLMRLHIQNEQRMAALRLYQEYAERLRQELDTAPSPNITALHEAIQSGQIFSELPAPRPIFVTAKPVTGPLAAGGIRARVYTSPEMVLEQPRNLLGRQGLVSRVLHLLENNERVLLAGMGGIGKTSVAGKVTAEYLAAKKTSAIWLETGVQDAAEIFMALARAFDQQQVIARQAEEGQAAYLRELLASRNGLLVLDNCWNERALFQVMKAVPPTMPVLLTSRQRIPIDGEIIALAGLDNESAAQLLGHHARRDYHNDAEAEALVGALGYHPFAIEIAGKRLKIQFGLTPAQLRETLRAHPHQLEVPGQYAEAGRGGIEELLTSSVETLTDAAQTVFIQMGALASPHATVSLLELICQCSSEEVMTMLAELEQRSLIEIGRDVALASHYWLHDLTFSYCRELFKESGRNRRSIVKAVEGFVDRNAQEFDQLEFELHNILGAVRAAGELREYDAFIGIVKTLMVDGYFEARGYTLELLEHLDAAIRLAQSLGDHYAETLHHLFTKQGNAFALRSKLDSALNSYNRAYALSPDPYRQVVLLTCIGSTHFRLGHTDYDEHFQRAEQIAQEHDDQTGLCRVLEFRGAAAAGKGDFQIARGHLVQAVSLAEKLDDAERLFFTVYNLGVTEIELGNHQQAQNLFQELLKLAQANETEKWIGLCFSGLARCFHGLGRPKQAHDLLVKAMAIFEQIGDLATARWVKDFMEKENYRLSQQ